MRAIALWGGAASIAVALGCRQAPASAPSDRSNAPAPSSLQKLAIRPRFEAPADGLLTDAMIDRYVRARRSAKGGSQADAFELIDSEELAWVRARILEAAVALDTRKLRAASEETYSRAIASLKRTRDSVHDKETLKSLNDQIAGLEKERVSLKEFEALPASIASNARRVGARRAEIDAAGR